MVKRVGVKPKVAGVNNATHGRIHHHANTAGDRVCHAHQFHEELANLQALVGCFIHHHGLQLKAIRHGQTEVAENFFDAADGKLATVNWRRYFWYDVRQATNVVEVAMGNNIGTQLMTNSLKIGRVGNAVVNARQVNAKVVAAVDNDSIVDVLDKNHVLGATTVVAAQWDELQPGLVIYHVGTARRTFLWTVLRGQILVGDALGVHLRTFLCTDRLAARSTEAVATHLLRALLPAQTAAVLAGLVALAVCRHILPAVVVRITAPWWPAPFLVIGSIWLHVGFSFVCKINLVSCVVLRCLRQDARNSGKIVNQRLAKRPVIQCRCRVEQWQYNQDERVGGRATGRLQRIVLGLPMDDANLQVRQEAIQAMAAKGGHYLRPNYF